MWRMAVDVRSRCRCRGWLDVNVNVNVGGRVGILNNTVRRWGRKGKLERLEIKAANGLPSNYATTRNELLRATLACKLSDDLPACFCWMMWRSGQQSGWMLDVGCWMLDVG